MRSWTTKEARFVLEWARQPEPDRTSVEEIARSLERTPEAVKEFIRRQLPRGQRPWREKPRWQREEREAVERGQAPQTRSSVAVRKFAQRHRSEEPDAHTRLTIREIAEDLCVSRATVYRYLKRGLLRRFKGGIAESSFETFLRTHPETIRYDKLDTFQKEWLILNGYPDSTMQVKRPSVIGLLD